MDWKIVVPTLTICSGITTVLSAKAIGIHGARIHYVLATTVFFVFAVGLALTNRGDFGKVTKLSWVISTTCGVLSILVFYKLACYWETIPHKLSAIMVIMSFSAIIIAIIEHLSGHPLSNHQWMGTILALIGVIMVSLK